MSSDYAQKLKSIRKAEGLTQKAFSDLVGIPLGSIKNYETGRAEAGLKTIELIVNNPAFTKYTLWLMTGSIAPESGQISPVLSPDGHGCTSNNQKGHKVG
ncbi:helix-turn-helix transcriptional regulator [Serratia fonticola]|jgi:transcriptional regulator with XRE-family HTH domain|uniref:helix-turn-helix domain-containing protein n=1 Tax=Serratia fonticola TaxID=47917 RepID=UPI00137807D8|nr:helix-turn-helix transcriptional regulator [Serratia fonticola]NBJ32266.1 helix-turn-helix domain-containing protein [Serratia fonticola]NYA43249.1 helix-turn-helix transcriptional regulator [Serratia fonticola]